MAALDGRIQEGDCILSVNAHNFMGLSKKEAVQVLKEAGGQVTLVIQRLEEPQTTGNSSQLSHPSSSSGKTSMNITANQGAEKSEKRSFSNIFSWMGKRGQQAAEKISKLVDDTAASLTSLGAFVGGGKSSSTSSEGSMEGGGDGGNGGGHLYLEDECSKTTTESSEPEVTSLVTGSEVVVAPEQNVTSTPSPRKMPESLEEAEHDFTLVSDLKKRCESSEQIEREHSSSKTSYTEVFTENGESRRSTLCHSREMSKSSLDLREGFRPLIAQLERRRSFQGSFQDQDGIDRDVSPSSMAVQASDLSSEDISAGASTSNSTPFLLQELLPLDSTHAQSEGRTTASVYRTVDELSSNTQTDLSTSGQESVPASADYSHVEKILQTPLPWSPQHYQLQGSPEEAEFVPQSKTLSSLYPKKWHRGSVNPRGEVLTFRDQESTLPRRISGSRENVRVVELRKGAGWLGMQLQGGVDPFGMAPPTPITVQTVIRGGAVYRSGRISEGDELIEVNGTSLANFTLREAVDTIREQPQGTIFFIVRDNLISLDHFSCRKKLF